MTKYKSIYSDKEVTAAQYIAEFMCQKRAISLNIDLPLKFWLVDHWKKYYIYQIQLANKLLKKYSDKSIIKALRSDKAKNTFSLKSQFIERIIKEYDGLLTENNTHIDHNRKDDITFRLNKSHDTWIDELNG